MIQICGVGLKIRGRAILESVNLTISSGDFWLIFGPNGAGKTTLFKVMTGMIQAETGTVRVAGKEIQKHTRRSLAREISYLPQFDEFTLPVTVRDILLSGRYPYAPWWQGYLAEDIEKMETAARQLGLEDFLPRDINTLSGGERKMVMLASAFIQDVSTILLDEPYTFLDPRATFLLNEKLRQLNDQGKTLVVISHQIDLIQPLASKMAAFKNGRLIFSGDRIYDPALFGKVYGISAGLWHEAYRDKRSGGGGGG